MGWKKREILVPVGKGAGSNGKYLLSTYYVVFLYDSFNPHKSLR